jgi:sugar (pentulose or hexulose) kinase
MNAKSTIESGKAILGIEFGSTRIKAVLIDQDNKPIAQGSHTWENALVDGLWTYSIDDIWSGLQDCYSNLRKNVSNLYGIEIEQLAAIGVSAMMHGYMAFDAQEQILVPFRTWRNTKHGPAAAELWSSSTSTYPCAGASRTSTRHPQRREPRARHQVPHHPGRIYPLAAHGP